jgi:uncharacterized protein YlxW (UPF0749 family)
VSRRLPARRRLTRPQWAISVGVGLGVIGFVGAAQWNSSLAREEFITSAQRVLIGEAEQLQNQQEQLRDDIEAANDRLRAFQEADAGSQAALGQLTERLTDAQLATGQTEVRGPGMVIEIADSLNPTTGEDRIIDYVVVDDLRDIVTALWGAGAEAISIAGGGGTGGVPAERIVSSTSIDGAGPAILVNSTRLSPPYRIEAVGPDGLADRFLAHPAYLARVEPRIVAYGLQFAFEARDEVTLPQFVGNTRLRWGAPVVEEAS